MERESDDFSTARVVHPVTEAIESEPDLETDADEDLGDDPQPEDDPTVIDEPPTEENA